MPLLASAYALHFTAAEMERIYSSLMNQIDNLAPNDPRADRVLEALKETHATSAGLKAFST